MGLLSWAFSKLFRLLFRLLKFSLFLTSLLCIYLSLNPEFSRHFIFMNHFRFKTFFHGLKPLIDSHVSEHRLKTDDGLELGAWIVHSFPSERRGDGEKRESGEWNFGEDFGRGLDEGKTKVVVLYFHGNAETRAQFRRQRTYEHIIQSFSKSLHSSSSSSYLIELLTFDYRGFGDSDGFPSEEGVVRDGMAAYSFVLENMKPDHIIFWGHSLGTGISTQVAKKIFEEEEKRKTKERGEEEEEEEEEEKRDHLLRGLVLEVPFRTLRHAAQSHWIALPIQWLPSSLFNSIFDLIPDRFETENHLPEIVKEIFVAIFHGKEDWVIHSQQGRDLFLNVGLGRGNLEREGERGGGREMMMHYEFERAGHNDVSFQADFPEVVSRFVGNVFWGKEE